MKHCLILFCSLISLSAYSQPKITPEEAAKHIGDSATVCGKVYGGIYLEKTKSQLTLLNVGAAYPANPFTVVISPAVRKLYPEAPELLYKDSTVCFTGKIVTYKEKPQMEISSLIQTKGGMRISQ